MRVLQINSVCGVGSTGRIATDIHNILIEQGHESYIAYGRDIPKNCDTSIKIGTKYDNYKHVALTRIFDKHGFGSKNATKQLLKKIEELNPDVIHLHNIHGYYINIELLFNYLKKANKPVVWTLHDCWVFTGHCSHFDYIGCDKWKKGCFDCPQKHEYPASILDNSLKNYKSKKDIFTGVENLTIITPSNWLGGLVKESFLKKYPVKIINNGIDLASFQPIQSQFRQKYYLDDKFIILGVANVWGEKKGYNSFLELSKSLSEDEVIVMVGVTERQKAELPPNIIGITKTNNIVDLAKIYSIADVFVNPTLEDSFPTTNLESLACGTPVITYATGGSIESIDSSCGAVIKNRNLKELYVSIQKFKVKMPIKTDIIKKSKQYDKNDRYMEYISYYSSLAKGV